MPTTIGGLFLLYGYGGSASPLGLAGPVLSLLAAWAAFVASASCVAWLAGLRSGSSVRLRSRVTCPACASTSPVYCLRCTRCRQELGVPPSSKPTYVIAMLAYAVFVIVFFSRPDRWF